MLASTTRYVWRHQWLRAVRVGSALDLLFLALTKGAALIGLVLLGIAFVSVLPEATGKVVVRETTSAVLGDYLFVIFAIVLMMNLWLSARGSIDLFAYKFYPISLRRLATIALVTRTIQVRYLSISVGAVITQVLLSSRIVFGPVLVTVMWIVLLDAVTLVIQEIHDEYAWISYMIITVLCVVTLFDMLGGHLVSRVAFGEWMGSADEVSHAILILTGTTCAAAFAAHRRLRTLLRYGA